MSEFGSEIPMSGIQQGWQCPVCKRVYSPSTYMCPWCGGEYSPAVTCGGTGPYTPPVNEWGKTTTAGQGVNQNRSDIYEMYERATGLDLRSGFFNAHGETFECGHTAEE